MSYFLLSLSSSANAFFPFPAKHLDPSPKAPGPIVNQPLLQGSALFTCSPVEHQGPPSGQMVDIYRILSPNLWPPFRLSLESSLHGHVLEPQPPLLGTTIYQL